MLKFKITNLSDVPITPMKGNRGTQLQLVNEASGTVKLDVHLNRLNPKEPGGKYHHHTKSDNVYIVKKGEGQLVVEEKIYTLREDDVVYIPAGQKHSLTNISDKPFEIFEIYAPAGEQFDFIIDE